MFSPSDYFRDVISYEIEKGRKGHQSQMMNVNGNVLIIHNLYSLCSALQLSFHYDS